jgi:hypothetical protein
VVIGVVLGGFFGVMIRVCAVAVRDVGVVAGLFVISRLMMLGGGAMVLRGVLVMLGCFEVVLVAFCRHVDEPSF